MGKLAVPGKKCAGGSAGRAFQVRKGLDGAALADLFAWTAAEFEERLAGSAIRRIGHERWLRNIAVALGNAGNSAETRSALAGHADHRSPIVREHVAWALARSTSIRQEAVPALSSARPR